ncbi:hypothetical protein L3Y34_012659 [Caenorhabditis briggsae]|uniref:Uncharacterized protein n=1 Tax=Caenorhabditis briggsae TaxID=6238 RepID=A0AAE8ZT91_CAEBR|nr:hypothetical protein L3Y34_012659 [Caenorhabditis briggsae]
MNSIDIFGVINNTDTHESDSLFRSLISHPANIAEEQSTLPLSAAPSIAGGKFYVAIEKSRENSSNLKRSSKKL